MDRLSIMVAAGLAETLNACGGSVRRTLACADPMKQEPTELTEALVSRRRRNPPRSRGGGSQYEPVPQIVCARCGILDADLFPGTSREWEW